MKQWIIDEEHEIYGKVVMMGVTGGEKYRWFEAKDKVITMIPLSFLQEDK